MSVTTCDLYEGTYYLLNGCELESIEGRHENGEVVCALSFIGKGLNHLQLDYLNCKAAANLMEFRRAYSYLSSVVVKTKRQLKKELKEARS